MMHPGEYTKFVVGALFAGVTAANTGLLDPVTPGVLTPAEWVAVAITVVATAALIWRVPNHSSGVLYWGKAITSGVAGGLGSLAVAVVEGGFRLETPEILAIILAIAAGSGLVALAPNAASSDGLLGFVDDTRDVKGYPVGEIAEADRRALPEDPDDIGDPGPFPR